METRVHLAAVTPWSEGNPTIHGPDIYGASAGKPFLYAVPATGERPIHYAAEALPAGLRLDSASGHITGMAKQEGEFRVLLRAQNRHGKAEKEFTIVIGSGLALTPPMGWNSWNAWRRWVDDAKVRAAADGLVQTGLAARGYTYVNIDSCWQGARGGKRNAIQPNSKFPDMGSLGSYIHAQGLKFGIYSTPWTVPWGCSDEEAMADWGGPGLIGCSSGAPDPAYQTEPIPTGHYVGLNKHEAEDVAQGWSGVWTSFDYLHEDWRPYIRPGGWHDLDMFALGPQFATATSSCPNKLTPDEQITHMTAWALYPSPLILSCDLTALSDDEVRLFGNEEVITVNQDRLSIPVPAHGAQLLRIGP